MAQEITFTELGLDGQGIVVQSGAEQFKKATITPGSNKISVTNGDGVVANPTLDVNIENVQSELSLANYYLKNDANELTISEPDQIITVELGASATNDAPVRLPPVNGGNWNGLKVFVVCNNVVPINIILQNGGLLTQAIPSQHLVLTCTDNTDIFGVWDIVKIGKGNGPSYSTASVTGPFPTNTILRSTGTQAQTWTILSQNIPIGKSITILRDSNFVTTINAGQNVDQTQTRFYYNDNTQAVFSTIQLRERYQIIKLTHTATNRLLVDFIHNENTLTATAPLEITDNDISIDQAQLSITASQVSNFTQSVNGLITNRTINNTGDNYNTITNQSLGNYGWRYRTDIGGNVVPRGYAKWNAFSGPGGDGSAFLLAVSDVNGVEKLVAEFNETTLNMHTRINFVNFADAEGSASSLNLLPVLQRITTSTGSPVTLGVLRNELFITWQNPDGTESGTDNVTLPNVTDTATVKAYVGTKVWLIPPVSGSRQIFANGGSLLTTLYTGQPQLLILQDKSNAAGNWRIIRFGANNTTFINSNATHQLPPTVGTHYVRFGASAAGVIELGSAFESELGGTYVFDKPPVAMRVDDFTAVNTVTNINPNQTQHVYLINKQFSNGQWSKQYLDYGDVVVNGTGTTVTAQFEKCIFYNRTGVAHTFTVNDSSPKEFEIVNEAASGTVTVNAGGAVTFRLQFGGSVTSFTIPDQYAAVSLREISTNTYLVVGGFVI